MKDINSLEVLQLLKPTAFSSATTVNGTGVDVSQVQADGNAMLVVNATGDTGSGNTISVQLQSSASSGSGYSNLGNPVLLTTAGGAGVFTGPVSLRETIGKYVRVAATSTDANSLAQTISAELIVLPKSA